MLPGRRQAIIRTSAGILLIGPLGTDFSEIINQNSNIFTQENAFENVVWKMAAILSRSQCVNSLRNFEKMVSDLVVRIGPADGLVPLFWGL